MGTSGLGPRYTSRLEHAAQSFRWVSSRNEERSGLTTELAIRPGVVSWPAFADVSPALQIRLTRTERTASPCLTLP